MTLEFKPLDETMLKPVMNGEEMPFIIRKGKGFMILEASGSEFTMQNQRFTRTDALRAFLTDAYEYLKTKKRKKTEEE